MTRSRRVFVQWVLLSAVGGLTFSCVSDAGECVPSYRRLGQDTVEVGPLTIKATWVLIGCRSDLERLTQKETAAAKTALASHVRELGWGMLRSEELATRNAAVRRVNQAIGRSAVSDVLIVDGDIQE
jgi:hypothetical protein